MADSTLFDAARAVKQSRQCARCGTPFCRTTETTMQWRIACKHCPSCERELLKERLRSRIIAEGECWNWQGSICSQTGYGKMSVHDHPRWAHRLSYELFAGPIPAGLSVLHKCDNRRCINPDHLFVGTQGDNMRDMSAKGRGVYGRTKGLLNGNAYLADEQVAEIRRRVASGEKQRDVAARFGCSQSTVWRMAKGIVRK